MLQTSVDYTIVCHTWSVSMETVKSKGRVDSEATRHCFKCMVVSFWIIIALEDDRTKHVAEYRLVARITPKHRAFVHGAARKLSSLP